MSFRGSSVREQRETLAEGEVTEREREEKNEIKEVGTAAKQTANTPRTDRCKHIQYHVIRPLSGSIIS